MQKPRRSPVPKAGRLQIRRICESIRRLRFSCAATSSERKNRQENDLLRFSVFNITAILPLTGSSKSLSENRQLLFPTGGLFFRSLTYAAPFMQAHQTAVPASAAGQADRIRPAYDQRPCSCVSFSVRTSFPPASLWRLRAFPPALRPAPTRQHFTPSPHPAAARDLACRCYIFAQKTRTLSLRAGTPEPELEAN